MEAWASVNMNSGLVAPEMAVPLKFHWKFSGEPVAVAQKAAFAPAVTVAGTGWIAIAGAIAGTGVGVGVGVGVGTGMTAIEDETPVIDGVTVSVAATDWEPSVFRVTGKVPVPFASALAAGRTAAPSLLVN